jgi:hypothetical protein
MKVYGNLVTGCHSCIFKTYVKNTTSLTYGCKAEWFTDITESVNRKVVDPDCPMLQEENHSITIMLSDQYNKSNG